MIFIMLLLLLLLVLLSLLLGTLLLQVCCILHNMLVQFEGLDTIGDDNCDYKDEESHVSEAGSEFNILVGATIDADVGEGVAEVQVGYAEKKSRLWVHHKYSLESGLIRWMKTYNGRMP